VYIRLIRLQKARDMLLSSALGIAEIAYETGFNDPKFFSRVFSEEFGMPPSVFREKMGK
jgi:transcriptional regulator GlxA family with amidase domain